MSKLINILSRSRVIFKFITEWSAGLFVLSRWKVELSK